MYPTPLISAILLAGGKGTRLKSAIPKQFLPLGSKPLALHSFELLAKSDLITEIIVVCESFYRHLFNSKTPVKIGFANPGLRRQDSVSNGLAQITKGSFVCIHDAARPFLQLDDLKKVIEQALIHKAAALAIPAKNTIKEIDSTSFVRQTLNREILRETLTPQVILLDLLKKGLLEAEKKKIDVTDDVSAIELMGHMVKLVSGKSSNIKITSPEDLQLAQSFLK
ncbi:2-C-methyl-D-erythritol 4-phosphate cytidylyltransferase [Candidatus Rhabdochlamydia sp. W815]|nr:2-C-methyl-D-erythritol 4-phosphate cytidylyltransferase [Candidatus Rhabdochlamydia sp. W815]KAG6559562.1 2-C-methyl-D-erythritol 4-phosphate cytidylyltransferase [Candidatus Rhabdochlamydia sp. W815]